MTQSPTYTGQPGDLYSGVDAAIIDAALALNPWMTPGLLAIYAQAYSSEAYGTPELALTQVRASAEYQSIFSGNAREDGTVRLAESDYLAYKEAFDNDLSEYVNPAYFEHVFGQLVENGVRYEEFKGRLETIVDRVALASDEIQAAYLEANPSGTEGAPFELYGTAALIAGALDPNVGDAVFNRRITLAEISGTAAERDFELDLEYVERLAEQGIDVRSSRDLFNRAASLLPTLDVLAARHNDPDSDFTIDEFLESDVFADQEQRERMRRLLSAEASLFRGSNAFVQSQSGGITGLTAR